MESGYRSPGERPLFVDHQKERSKHGEGKPKQRAHGEITDGVGISKRW